MELALAVTCLALLAALAFTTRVLKQHWVHATVVERVSCSVPRSLPAVHEDGFSAALGSVSGASMTAGNAVELFLCGDELYPRLLADLRAARREIAFHVFWMRPGRLFREVKETLCARAAAGVRVRVVLDAVGVLGALDELSRELTEGGVEVAQFRPITWRRLSVLQHRSHRRAVVIDGAVGYTGGFGIDDAWQGDGRSPGSWRDTSVRLEGPVLGDLYAAFAATWAEASRELLLDQAAFGAAPSPRANVARAGLFGSAPTQGGTNAERAVAIAVGAARRRLWITSAYFAPDEALRALLVAAARRGVDVRVLTPGDNTDKKPVQWAARGLYDELLDAGIRVWEYAPTMIHAKSVLVDDAFAMVGTVNLDVHSLALNQETELVVADRGFASRMADIFEADLRFAREVTREEHARRGRLARAQERLALRLLPLL